MADIISQLNLTEQELKENEKVLQEIVKTIDKIENSKGINITDSFVKEFNTDRDWIKNMKGALEGALENLKIRFGVDIVVDDKIARQINEKMQKQFGKGPDLDLVIPNLIWDRSTTKSQYKEEIRDIKHDFETELDFALNDRRHFSLENLLDTTKSSYKYYNESVRNSDNIKGVVSAPTYKFNELKGKGYELVSSDEIVKQEEKIQKEQEEITKRAQDERARLLEEGRKRAAERTRALEEEEKKQMEEMSSQNNKSTSEFISNEKLKLKVFDEETQAYKEMMQTQKSLSELDKNNEFDGIASRLLKNKLAVQQSLRNETDWSTYFSEEDLKRAIDAINDALNGISTAKANNDIQQANNILKDFNNTYHDLFDPMGGIYEINLDSIERFTEEANVVKSDIKELDFENLKELGDDILTDVNNQLEKIIDNINILQNKRGQLTEFSEFKTSLEKYNGFIVSDDDKSENVRNNENFIDEMNSLGEKYNKEAESAYNESIKILKKQLGLEENAELPLYKIDEAFKFGSSQKSDKFLELQGQNINEDNIEDILNDIKNFKSRFYDELKDTFARGEKDEKIVDEKIIKGLLSNSIDQTDSFYNELVDKNIDIGKAQDYLNKIHAQNSIDDYNRNLGNEIEGMGSLINSYKNLSEELVPIRNLIETIQNEMLNMQFGGDKNESRKNIQDALKGIKKENDQSLEEFYNIIGDEEAYNNIKKVEKENKEKYNNEKNKIIDEIGNENILNSDAYKKNLDKNKEVVNTLNEELGLIKEINKEKEVNLNQNTDAGIIRYNEEVNAIGQAENASKKLLNVLKEIDDKDNLGLFNSTDVLASNAGRIADIYKVLSKDYKNSFDQETTEQLKTTRSNYDEILQIVEKIKNRLASDEFKEDIGTKAKVDAAKYIKGVEEAKAKFNENRLKYEETLFSGTKDISGYQNSIDKLKNIIDNAAQKRKEELEEKGLKGLDLSTAVASYSSKLRETYGVQDLEIAKDKIKKTLDEIKEIYTRAGEKLPENLYENKTTDLLGLNTNAKNLIHKDEIAKFREEVEERYNKEKVGIEKLRDTLNKYNQQLANSDTTGLDKAVRKLEIYNNEIDRALRLGDLARAKNIFGYYEDQFKSVSGRELWNIEKEKADKQAQIDEQRALKEAQRAAEQAQKQYEQNLNNLKNKVQEVTGYIKQAIANTIKIIREANSIVNRSISLMISVFDKLGSTVQRIISLFGNFGDRLKAHTKQGNILKGTYTELKSKIDLLVGAFNKLFNNQFINEGKKLLSSVQTLNMLIGTELTSKTMEWANSLEHAFGLSASSLIADLKEITAVLYGLGMSSKNVQIAATNLEAVAMSLSATTGYDFSTVINKIQSGMKGMTQSIDDLGLSVRESQMDAFLKKLKAQGGEYANIGTSFSQLTEQQRIYVRYAAIMDQFTSKSAYSAENYSKSLRTITGGLSVLNSQLRGLKSELGSLALQLFSKIIQPLIYIIYLVRRAVAWVAKLLNIDLTLNPLMNGGEENVIPIEDEANALNDLADAADKAKGSLDSLDHVSTLSSSSDKNKDKFDYSSLMNISDDYAKVLEELGKLQDDFIEECKRKFWEMINEIKDRFTNWVKEVTGRVVDWDKIKENFEKIKENFKQTLENMKRIAKAAFNIIGGLLYSVFDDLDSTDILAKFTTTIEKFTGLVATILEKIQPYIQNFYDKYLSKYVIKFGDWIEAKLDSINNKLDEWQKHWDNVGEKDQAIIAWFDELGRKVEKVIKFIKEIFIVFKALFGFKFSEKDTFDVTQMSDGMKSTLGIAHDLHYTFLDILDIITKTATKIFDFNGSGSLDLGDLEIALGKIKDKLDEIRQFIEDNKESISSLLAETVTTVTTLAAAKFNILMQLIELIVNNADTITRILRALQDIIEYVSDNPIKSLGIATGIQSAFSVGKALVTVVMWKKILGLGAGGTIAQALAGIQTSINNVISGTAAAETVAAETGEGAAAETAAGVSFIPAASAVAAVVGAVAATRQGIKEVYHYMGDLGNVISGFNKKVGDTTTYAYEVRRALTEAYGKDIDTSQAERAFITYAQIIGQQLELTEAETVQLALEIKRQYNRLGDELDSFGSTYAYSTDNSSKRIRYLADTFKELDEKQTQTSDVSKKTSNSIQEDTKKSSDAIKTNVDSSVGSIEELNTAYNDSITDLRAYKSDTVNTWNSISSLITRKISTIKASISSLNNSHIALSNSITTAGSGYAPKRIRGFATGGLPRSGSLFMANENGNTELVGNFGGYSGVANQNMIIEAMQNAMVQAIRQAGGFNNAGTTYNNYNIGNWLGDEAGIRKLAKQLNNANARSNSNIANTGFVMS